DVMQIMNEEGFAPEAFGVVPVLSEDGHSFLPAPDLADRLFGTSDEAVRAEAASHLRPEPCAPMMTKLKLTPERWGRLPKIYLETRRDDIVPLGAQRAMIARNKPDAVIPLEMGHSLIRTDAEAISALLVDIAGRYMR